MSHIPNGHPTLWIRSSRSRSLEGRTIVLAVTGSIAAVRTVELARELIRRGADVHAVMSKAATLILNPMALHYATGNEVITDITGKVEHVEFFGNEGRADLLIVTPATANTIGKIAMGIDDTPVTTFATTAIGARKPLMVVPAMHEDMYRHPAVISNLDTLRSWGIELMSPRIEEGIAKVCENAGIVLMAERILGTGLLGKRIMITSGATAEPVDPIRILTNRASGKTGIELAMEAYRRGADVTIVHRNKMDTGGANDGGINEIFVESADQMTNAVLSELKKGYDALISAAAISDYTLTPSPTKIRSEGELTLSLSPTRKLIREARGACPKLRIIGFKAETDIDKDELFRRAQHTMDSSGLDMIVANDVSTGGIGTDDNCVHFIRPGQSPMTITGKKSLIASALMDALTVIISEGERH